jgi:hypothetical protein
LTCRANHRHNFIIAENPTARAGKPAAGFFQSDRGLLFAAFWRPEPADISLSSTRAIDEVPVLF